MTRATSKGTKPPTLPPPSETEFQATVVDLAQTLGWNVMHVRRAKVRNDRWATPTSVPGWPDLTMWHPRQQRLAFVELKSQAGQTSAEQRAVLNSLDQAGAEVYVWRPSDFDCLRAVLEARPTPLPTEGTPNQ